ncbi:hypothetical protein KR032_008781 [Drosophila birchii]|nr:hypothetical protein KR032_008781 [Drosophila birchii]
MKFAISFAVISLIFSLSLLEAAPINDPGFVSATDITGEPVRQKRASADYYQGDYFICYPKSEVYGKSRNGLSNSGSNRRSYDSEAYGPHYLADDSFEARKDRADARRAAYTDSYGK